MKYTGPVRFIFKGDINEALKYTSRSRLLLAQARERMGPDKAFWNRVLPDGTEITVSSLGGINQVWINTSAISTEANRFNHGFYFPDEGNKIISKIGGEWVKLETSDDYSGYFPNPVSYGQIGWSGIDRFLGYYSGSFYAHGYEVAQVPAGTVDLLSFYIDKDERIVITVYGTFASLDGTGYYIFTKPFIPGEDSGNDLYDISTAIRGWKKRAYSSTLSDITPGGASSLLNYSTTGFTSLIEDIFTSDKYVLNNTTLTAEKIEDHIGNPLRAYIYRTYRWTHTVSPSSFERVYTATQPKFSTENYLTGENMISGNTLITPKIRYTQSYSESTTNSGSSSGGSFEVNHFSNIKRYADQHITYNGTDYIPYKIIDTHSITHLRSTETAPASNDLVYTTLIDNQTIGYYGASIRHIGQQPTGYIAYCRPKSDLITSFKQELAGHYYFDGTMLFQIIRLEDNEVMYEEEIETEDMIINFRYDFLGIYAPEHESTCTDPHWFEAPQPPDSTLTFPSIASSGSDRCDGFQEYTSGASGASRPLGIYEPFFPQIIVSWFSELEKGRLAFVLGYGTSTFSGTRGFVVNPSGDIEEILEDSIDLTEIIWSL